MKLLGWNVEVVCLDVSLLDSAFFGHPMRKLNYHLNKRSLSFTSSFQTAIKV